MSQFIPHPIPYQGSKRNLAARILAFFPKDATRIIEPFAGSSAVSLAARHQDAITSVVLGDADAAIMQLWDDILNKPQDLADAYEFLWTDQTGRERWYYDSIRAQFNKTPRSDYFLYLLARCVKASVRYNAHGEFNQSPDNRRRGAHPHTVRKHLVGASNLLANRTRLMCGDYGTTLSLSTPSDIVYLDPPYQGVSQKRDQRYRSKVTFDDFVGVLQDLNNRHISYIVSYDGKTGEKSHGKLLPDTLDLIHFEIQAGRSAQETLLGRQASTTESLYLSPVLINRIKPALLETLLEVRFPNRPIQLDLFTTLASL